MQRERLENLLFAALLNPMLRRVVALFDVECAEDGSLLLNSLRDFLGEEVHLCGSCSNLSRGFAESSNGCSRCGDDGQNRG
jgi:hypothetical protein